MYTDILVKGSCQEESMHTVSIVKLSNRAIEHFMKRKQFTTTIDQEALKNIKKLAIDLDRPVNDLLEEAIKWLLKKYEKTDSK